MLIEAGVLFVAYSGIRLFEKFRDKPTKNIIINQASADKQVEHRLNTSYVSLGVSTTRQFFYSSPLVVFLNIGLYIYNSVPHMKQAETTLLKEQKLSGHMIETILIIAAISTNQYFVASLVEVIYYLSDNKIKAKTQDKSKDMLINVFDQHALIGESQPAGAQLCITSFTLLAVGPVGATTILNTNFGYHIKLSEPLSTLNYLNLAPHHSILIKDVRSLELLTGIDTILFDKTSILFQEQPEVAKIIIIISDLRKYGIKYIAIVSGDNKSPTQKLAEELGMDNYFYEVLPQDKAKIVEKLQQQGKSVCFIGDGVNDAVAMKKANVSISIRGATSIATDLAQVVFMDDNLSHLCQLFDIANGLDSQLRKSLVISLTPLPIKLIGILFLDVDLLPIIVVNQISFSTGIGKIEHDKRST